MSDQLREELAEVLRAAWFEVAVDRANPWMDYADALLPVVARIKAEAKAEALRPIHALADEWAEACYSPGVHTKCKGHALRRALAEASGEGS